MTIQDLYTAYLTGKPLGTLTSRAARQLLDLARNAILTKGKEPKFSVSPGTAESEKQSLLAASDQLRQLGLADQTAIYASANHDALGGRTLAECEQLLADFRATTAKYPTRPKPAAKPASDPFVAVQEQFAKAKRLAAAEDAKRTPSPRTAPVAARPTAPAPVAKPAPAKPSPAKPLPPPPSITSGAFDPHKLAAQAAAQAAKRPKPAPAPAPAARPMKNLDLGHLRSIASRPGFKPADKAQALAEMAARGWTRTESCWTKSGKA